MSRTTVFVALVAAALVVPVGVSALTDKNPRSDSGELLLADMALARGDCVGGTTRYLKASRKSNDASVAQRAVEVANECHQMKAVAEAVKRWQKLAPESLEAANAVAMATVRLYQTAEATRAFARVHALGGDRALANLLDAASEAGGATIALASSRRMLDAETASTELLSAGSTVALEAFDFATSRALVERELASDPASGDARAQLARVLAAQGESVAALSAAQEAAALAPDSQRFAYADTLIRLDRMDEARAELESLRADGALREEADLRLGRLAYQLGDNTEAGRRFGSLISSQTAAAEAFFYLSSIAEREGRADLALEGYERLAEAGAGLVARGRAARLLMKKDDRDGAFKLLDAVATKDKSLALDVEFAKAALLEEVGKNAEAVVLLERALALYPDHPGVRYQMGLTQEKAGLTRESIRTFESLLKDRPQDAGLLNALGYSLADRNQSLPRAEDLIRRALTASPDNPAFLDSLGWVQFRRGDVASALPNLERAYRIYPDAEIAAHWGEILWRSGKQAEARALWARSLASAPESKALRATIERLTGTSMEPAKPPQVAPAPAVEPATPDK
jgi:tetratricopeptide (TPR) repeat protein